MLARKLRPRRYKTTSRAWDESFRRAREQRKDQSSIKEAKPVPDGEIGGLGTARQPVFAVMEFHTQGRPRGSVIETCGKSWSEGMPRKYGAKVTALSQMIK